MHTQKHICIYGGEGGGGGFRILVDNAEGHISVHTQQLPHILLKTMRKQLVVRRQWEWLRRSGQ